MALVLGATAGAVFAAAPEPPLPGDEAPRCDLDSPLNVVGFDTRSGALLVGLPGQRRGAFLVGWQPEGTAAPIERAPSAGPWFGGSVGPGAPFVFERCGAGCLQPVILENGTWSRLGEPLTVPSAATVQGTYDRSGTPWVVVHGRSSDPKSRSRFLAAWAFRLAGREWRPEGHLEVTSVGTPAALPAPWLEDAVVSGTGLFAAGSAPRTWVHGLPAASEEPGSQLVPLSEQQAAFVSAEGVAFRSADGGTTWARSSWRPWPTGTAEPWARGKDYTVDRPLAGTVDVLPLVWFDNRLAGREELLFSEMDARGHWRQVAGGDGRIPTSAGEDLEASAVLRDDQGRWTVLFGCVTSGGTPSLVLAETADGALGAPRLVPLRPAPSTH